jgi:hypothetical protein
MSFHSKAEEILAMIRTSDLGKEIQTGFQQWKSYRPGCQEVDFGCWWTLDGEARNFPRWRVSWFDSGELYAVHLDRGQPDRYLVIAHFRDQAEVERAMAGWMAITPNLPAIVEQARQTAFAGQPDEDAGADALPD